MKKRILSIVLAVVMIVGMIPLGTLTAFAEPADLTDYFEEGDGSGENPYEIGSKEDLEKLAEIVIYEENNCADTYFVLTGDIGSTNDPVTTMIGEQEEKSFNGHFNGNGHTVTVELPDDWLEYFALFSVLGNGGEIINLTTAGCVSNEDANYVGGVCGKNNGTIANCCNTAEVSGQDNVGGVCGSNNGTITNCCNTATASGDNFVGGVCGQNNGTITNCYNTSTVNGDDSEVGGVCGIQFEGTITNCYHTGTVSGNEDVGGVCGQNWDTITNCYHTGTVSGKRYVGGVCGYNYSGTITNCYCSDVAYSGNVVGDGTGTKTDCFKLSAAQMQAASKAVLTTGVANNKPLVDLLNEYVTAHPTDNSYKLMDWTNKQGEYPTLCYPVTVNGTVITDANKNDVLNDGGSVQLTDYSNYGIAELTLTDANITGTETILSATCNLSLVLEGNNILGSTGENPAISCSGTQYGNLKILGEGNLTATSTSGYAISVLNNCEFLTSGTVTATGGIHGIVSWNGTVKVSNATGIIIAHGADSTCGAMKTTKFEIDSKSHLAVSGSDKADATVETCSAAWFDTNCFKVVSEGEEKVAKTVILRPAVCYLTTWSDKVYYATLAEAAAAPGGYPIDLLQDSDEDFMMIYPEVPLYFEGHKYTGTVSAPEGYMVIEDYDCIYITRVAAKVNGQGYLWLGEAIEAAQEGDVVRLYRDIDNIPGGNQFKANGYTIDLNGYTLEVEDVRLEYYGCDTPVIFTDSSEDGTGTVKCNITVRDCASLEIQQGTYEGEFSVEGEGSITIYGGRFKYDPNEYAAEGVKFAYNEASEYYEPLKPVSVPEVIDPITYDGKDHTPYEETDAYTVSGDVTGKNVGEYTVTFELKDGYAWDDEDFDGEIEWSIAKATVAVPTITGQVDNMFLYTGDEIVALESNEYYTVENGSKTASGKYTATVTLKDTDNYEWDDNFDGFIEWYIVNAEYYLTTAPTTTEDGAYNQRAYYMDGDTKVTVENNLLGEDQSIDFAGWYLRSMIQYKINEKGDYDIRFISMLNGECFADDKLADYESAGFIISIGDETFYPLTTTIGYTSFLADGKEISITDYSDNPNGTDFFFLMNTTFATADIDVNTEIKVTPFVKLIDGETTLKGNTASFTLSQLIKK